MRYSILVLALAAAVTIDAAPKTTSKPTVAQAMNKAAHLNQSDLYTEVVFPKGGSDLSADAQNQLRDLLADARAEGKIASVKVVAWADREYPKNRRTLDRSSRKIADDRGLEIKNYFTDHAADVKVELYNMAERPDNVEKILNMSKDVHLKKSLEETGLAHPSQAGLPKNASRAIVMVEME